MKLWCMIIHFAAKEKIGQENKHMDEQSNAYADCGMLLMKETLFQFCKASSMVIDFGARNALEFYSLCRLIIVIVSLMFLDNFWTSINAHKLNYHVNAYRLIPYR